MKSKVSQRELYEFSNFERNIFGCETVRSDVFGLSNLDFMKSIRIPDFLFSNFEPNIFG
jgi:hypothetical protein